jgi:hypothetical protein
MAGVGGIGVGGFTVGCGKVGVGERTRVGIIGVKVGKGDGTNCVGKNWVAGSTVIGSGVMLGMNPSGVTVAVTVGGGVAVTTCGPLEVGVAVLLRGEAVPQRNKPTQ